MVVWKYGGEFFLIALFLDGLRCCIELKRCSSSIDENSFFKNKRALFLLKSENIQTFQVYPQNSPEPMMYIIIMHSLSTQLKLRKILSLIIKWATVKF